LIVGPSEDTIQAGNVKKDIAERYNIRHRFWTELLKKAKQKTQLHANISPGQHSWIGASSGRSGIAFNYSIRQHDTQIELYIDRGTDSQEENKNIFDQLYSNKDVIEKNFGDTLLWDRLDMKRASRISKQILIGGYRDEARWDEIIDAMVNNMINFAKAIKPHLKDLKL